MTLPPSAPADRIQAALWISAGIAILAMLYLLSPILTPFLLGGIVAYICSPLVDRMAATRLPRVVAVLLVLALLGLLLAGLVLIVLPLIHDEVKRLMERLPQAVHLVTDQLAPWLAQRFGIDLKFDVDSLQALASGNWDTIQTVLQRVYNSLKIGGVALVGVAVNAMLAPVVAFYLLLDWRNLVSRLDHMIPRPWHAKVRGLAGDIDAVLSEVLRGQVLVMLALATYYSLALWIAGLPSALPLGLITGLLVFVPYLGYGTGLTLAMLVAILQFAGWGPIIAVAAVYGIGQMLESFLLTPFLVGERIGLPPLAVIFALMAFGQVFGFFGILLALPASAALLIGLREIRRLYLASSFYRGGESP